MIKKLFVVSQIPNIGIICLHCVCKTNIKFYFIFRQIVTRWNHQKGTWIKWSTWKRKSGRSQTKNERSLWKKIVFPIFKMLNLGSEISFLRSLTLTDEDFKQLDGAEILLMDNNLLPAIISAINNDSYRSLLSSLRWVQNTWAGVDILFQGNIPDMVRKSSLTLTRFSGPSFGHAMAEYVLGQILNYERNFYYLHSSTTIEKQW